ncbi:MAG TPA: tRNA pseudouridine(55) synthase TruB [Deltaproteobacteria bacterium]|nr:tRNA pseudouridine(55) synthase TruB [Deltaproteobacteria bacterium]
MDGFLVIDKPLGWTSQQVVSRLRRALGVRKMGHTGTLDPLATGVLPLALGEATKIIPFLDESLKRYWVTARFGAATDTYDAEGRVTEEAAVPDFDISTLEKTLSGFLGEQEQLPPAFSAVKVGGKPLYRYAREGREVERKPRRIVLHQLQIQAWEKPDLNFEVLCSKGTYIRSLVHDLGMQLGCFAHVRELRRLQSGPFGLQQALAWDSVLADPKSARAALISIENLLSAWPKLVLESEEEVKRVRQGVALRRISQVIEGHHLFLKKIALTRGEKIVALVEAGPRGDFFYLRVLGR